MATRHRRTVGQSSKSRQVRERRGHALKGRRQAPSRGQVVLVYLFLTAITWLVFGQTVRHEFVNFDDHVYVYDNPLVAGGLNINGIVSAFTHPQGRNWHPLTTVSHMLDCQLYGLNAGGHHFTSVALHTIAVLLLFGVLRVTTGALWPSAFVAALFAIHPLHVESVAWVSERKDVLSAVFFMLTLAAYVRYVRAPSPGRYFFVAMIFALGLMSKPMLVTVPFVLLLLDYWPLRRFDKGTQFTGRGIAGWLNQRPSYQQLFLEKTPLLILSGLSCLLTIWAQDQGTGSLEQLPFTWRLNNAVVSYIEYVRQTFWPARLAVFYPHPNNELPIWQVTLATTLLLLISAMAILLRKKRPYVFTGWFWYVGMLMPVIGIVQIGEQGHADRYTYLPHIGLFLLIVWTAVDLATTWHLRREYLWLVPAATIAVLSYLATDQTSFWKNSEKLWDHALSVTSNNDFAHNNLGFLYLRRGELDKAISHFETALEIRSGNSQMRYNLGTALVHMNLANALARKGKPEEAIVHYEEAVKLRPDYGDAYYNFGSVLFQQGRIDDAIAQWQKAVAIQPNDAAAHTSLGNALLQKGWPEQAIVHYQRALQIDPGEVNTRNNMAWVLATSSDPSIRNGAKAVSLAAEAVEISGGKDAIFFRTLAASYSECGKFADAIAAAEKGQKIAISRGDSDLARTLEKDIALYRADIPLHQSMLH
jgi:tetratricopeptide (TPR) repeat protein